MTLSKEGLAFIAAEIDHMLTTEAGRYMLLAAVHDYEVLRLGSAANSRFPEGLIIESGRDEIYDALVESVPMWASRVIGDLQVAVAEVEQDLCGRG